MSSTTKRSREILRVKNVLGFKNNQRLNHIPQDATSQQCNLEIRVPSTSLRSDEGAPGE
jgi:hypothetical protein